MIQTNKEEFDEECDCMKKKRLIVLIIGCLIVIGIGVFVFSGQKPYKNLRAEDIASATVYLAPPDKTIQIVEIKELVTYLKELVIYNEDNSYTEYDGQAVIFTLTMFDGSQEEIMVYNPFVVINGTGYKTKYEPCEKLNRYANQLLDSAE